MGADLFFSLSANRSLSHSKVKVNKYLTSQDGERGVRLGGTFTLKQTDGSINLRSIALRSCNIDNKKYGLYKIIL